MRAFLAALGVVFLFAGCATQQPSPGSSPPANNADRSSGAEDSIEALPLKNLAARNRLRDSIRMALEADSSFDSSGAVLAWRDTAKPDFSVVLVDLKPSEEAFRRIRKQVAGYILEHDDESRVGVDFDAPRMTPTDSAVRDTTSPSLKNPKKIQSLMQNLGWTKAIPECGGRGEFDAAAVLWLFASWRGQVLHVTVKESSGRPVIDKTAVVIGNQMIFKPATQNGTPVGVWIRQRTRFGCE